MNHFLLKYTFLLGCTFLLLIPEVTIGQKQDANRDSLLTIVSEYDFENNTDTTLVNTLLELSESYRYTQFDSTLFYAERAISAAEAINYTKGALNARYLQAIVYYNRGDYQQTYEIGTQSLQEAGNENFKRERALLNQLIGISYSAQGNYHLGLQYFLDAYELSKNIENDLGVFQNLNNIGVSYLKLEDYEEALDIFLELDSLRTLEPATISIPVNLGFIYYELGELDQAEEQLMRILNFEGGMFDQRAIGLSTFKLGEIHLDRNEYSSALNYFNRSIDMYEELGNDLEKVQSLDGIARTYLQQQKLNQALEYAKQAYEIAEKFGGLPEKNSASQTLYKIYKARDDYKNALSYHELFKNLSDSLKNEDISREVGRLEAEFEFQERELELRQAQQQKNLENAERVANRNILILIAFSLLVIAVIVAFLLYRNSKIRKKANELLREKNEQIEQQARKLEEMNQIKTQLFSIISHDLRGPLSSLYGFITLYEMDELSQENIRELIPELSSKFKYTSNLLNNLLNWARSQLDGYNVSPESFNLNEQLVKNIRLLSQQASKKDLSIENAVSDEVPVFADPNMINLVLLNLLSNAIKFTPKGGNIKLGVEKQDDKVQFFIEDNGVGISEEQLKKIFEEPGFYSTNGTEDEQGTGLGLMLCKDFIEKNNGDFWADSEEGKGSTFYFTLPTE